MKTSNRSSAQINWRKLWRDLEKLRSQDVMKDGRLAGEYKFPFVDEDAQEAIKRLIEQQLLEE